MMLSDTALQTGDLLTVAGAGAAALVVAQFVKVLLHPTAAVVRGVAMLTGLAVVVISTVVSLDQTSILEVILSVIVGMQAGLSASATVDISRDGLNYEAVERVEGH